MNGHFNLYAELRKIEEEDDETVKVSGYASSEVVDSAGEIVTASAIRDALPDYFKGGTGALREMHAMIAAGVVVEAEIDAKNRTAIVAKVVDPGTIKKLRAGVFKGFSIGGKTLARDPQNRKVITKIRLDEISLVDRPSCPEAVLDVFKADGYGGNGVAQKLTATVEHLEGTLADIARRLTKLDDAARGTRK